MSMGVIFTETISRYSQNMVCEANVDNPLKKCDGFIFTETMFQYSRNTICDTNVETSLKKFDGMETMSRYPSRNMICDTNVDIPLKQFDGVHFHGNNVPILKIYDL